MPDGVAFQTKPAIAGDLIEEALGDGLTAAPVLGDSVYGNAQSCDGGCAAWGWSIFSRPRNAGWRGRNGPN